MDKQQHTPRGAKTMNKDLVTIYQEDNFYDLVGAFLEENDDVQQRFDKFCQDAYNDMMADIGYNH